MKIALCGKMRSGKDTVADYLVSKYGYTRFAFGDELKRYYHELFGIDKEGAKAREGYQWFGQALRERDEELWVRKCFDNIGRERMERQVYPSVHHYKPLNPVITDVRQPNELARCRAEGYVIIKVEADETTRLERIKACGDNFDISDLRHSTELYVDEINADFTIWNGTGVSTRRLYEQIDAIMKTIEGR